MVAGGGPIREANQDSEAARRVKIGLSRSESTEHDAGVRQTHDVRPKGERSESIEPSMEEPASQR